MKNRDYLAVLESLSELIDEGIQCVDSDGVTFFYNKKMAQLEDTDADSVIGKGFADIYPAFPESESTLLKAIRENEPTLNKQQTYFNIAGKEITTINTTVPIKSGGKVIGALEVAKDITQLREMTDKIIEYQGGAIRRQPRNKGNGVRNYTYDDIIGHDEKISKLKRETLRVADNPYPVLITGETGTGKSRILTFVGSYHGQTMGSYAMSGHPSQSKIIGGGNVVKLPYPYCYRCAFEKDRETCDLFCLRYIENYIFDAVASPDQIGAIVIEAVQCDGGDVVPADGFLKGLEALCKKHNILFIIDEVKIGFGRTGKMFGFENWDITPDAIVMGKPMGGGQPLSAVVGRKELLNAGVGMHLFTTAGNPVACAAGLETIKIIEDEKLRENAKEMGDYLVSKFNEMKEEYPVISDVRGKGLVIGVEFVEDRETKKPASDLMALLVYRCYELGLLIYDSGINANVLELTPPLIITREQCDQAVSIIKQALDDVLAGKITMDKLEEFAGWS